MRVSRRWTMIWTVATMLLVLVMGAVAERFAPRPRVALSAISIADTVWIRGSWTGSTDARGNAVDLYHWALLDVTGAKLLEGDTVGLGVVRYVMRPLPGDTLRLVMEVFAIDSKGKASQTGRSNVLVIGTPWTDPTTPLPTIDTLAYEPGHPDGLFLYIAPPTWGGRADITGPGVVAAPGDTFTVFALDWTGSYAFAPAESVKWSITSCCLIQSTGWNKALVKALLQSPLPPALPQGIPVTAMGRP